MDITQAMELTKQDYRDLQAVQAMHTAELYSKGWPSHQ